MVDSMISSLESMEVDESFDFELDGDTLITDGEEMGEVTIVDEDELELELADEAAESFEAIGVSTTWTLERD